MSHKGVVEPVAVLHCILLSSFQVALELFQVALELFQVALHPLDGLLPVGSESDCFYNMV